MSWSSRRRSLYFLGFLVALIVLVGIPLFFFFYEAPTCTDGKQNGTEDGIDCGGNCPIVCSFSAADPIVRWSRLFEVVPGVYSVVARVENPNATVAAYNVPYTFKLRAADNMLVYEQKGTVYLSPKSIIPIFETGLQTGSRVPTRVEFSLGEPVWVNERSTAPDVSVRNQKLENPNERPVLTATIKNETTDPTSAFAAVAVLYDVSGNAVHVSRTIVESLPPLGDTQLIFTWPQPFSTNVARIEIIPVFN